jgi:hypothetical protein
VAAAGQAVVLATAEVAAKAAVGVAVTAAGQAVVLATAEVAAKAVVVMVVSVVVVVVAAAALRLVGVTRHRSTRRPVVGEKMSASHFPAG